jgi:nucleoside-diphosphate-sugar epimerase
MESLFADAAFGNVIHLAAQPGVRESIQHPHACVEANLTGFLHVLEGCRRARVRHLIYASSSSVYGGNTKLPFATADAVDSPISLYAASKRANELMAHCYSHLYGLPATGLRFFTVYGPWGRPDMAPFRFAAAILSGQAIEVYNYGRMWRDFTYIDDIAEGVLRIAAREPAGYRLFNVGSNQPWGLMEFIGELEGALGRAGPQAFSAGATRRRDCDPRRRGRFLARCRVPAVDAAGSRDRAFCPLVSGIFRSANAGARRRPRGFRPRPAGTRISRTLRDGGSRARLARRPGWGRSRTFSRARAAAWIAESATTHL